MTADETKITTVPGKIFTIDDTVLHRDIRAVPKGIFAVKNAITDGHTTTILESIIALLMIILRQDIISMHAQIIGVVKTGIPYGHILAIPQSLLSI